MRKNMSHIRWAFDLSKWRPTKDDLLLATACIQPEEKIRLHKFVFREDFDASLIGRLMMRKFVSEAAGLDYERIRFSRDSKGKPYWDTITSNYTSADNLYVDFNVSHQGSYSVLAGIVASIKNKCLAPSIGVDVMRIEYSGGKRLDEFFRLMDRNFSTTEWRTIKQCATEREQLASFMRHWCLKESYVKNIGVGITVDLRSISFDTKGELNQSTTPRTDTTVEVHDPQPNWSFHEYLLDADHIATVSLQNSVREQSVPDAFELVDFETLMQNAKPFLEVDEEYCHQIMEKERKCLTK